MPDRLDRWWRPSLDHLLTTNEFFARLHHAARINGGGSSGDEVRVDR